MQTEKKEKNKKVYQSYFSFVEGVLASGRSHFHLEKTLDFKKGNHAND